MKINGSFLILTAMILIFLKLIGELTISWFWVLTPLWFPFAIFLAVMGIWFGALIFAGIMVLIVAFIEWVQDRR